MHIRYLTAVILLATISPAHGIAQQVPRRYAVDLNRSSLFLVTHRAGLFSFLGHEHAIVPMDWTAQLCLADPIPPSATGSVLIQSGSLVIDTDAARALAGLGSGPNESELPELRAKMLDAEHLDAHAFPETEVMVDSIALGTPTRLSAFGRLSLHGVTRDVTVPVDVTRLEDGATQLAGHLRIRQRDFGIEPESRAGLVKVSNDIDLHFTLVAAPGQEPCGSAKPM